MLELDGYSKRLCWPSSPPFLGPRQSRRFWPGIQADSLSGPARYVDARPLYERVGEWKRAAPAGSGEPGFRRSAFRRDPSGHGNGPRRKSSIDGCWRCGESRPDADRTLHTDAPPGCSPTSAFAQQRYADAASDHRFLLETRSAVFNDDNAQTGVILSPTWVNRVCSRRPMRPSLAIAGPSSSFGGLPGANAELANAENNLGVPFSRRAGLEAAEHLLEALRIREAILPADDLDLATSLNNVATEQVAHGDIRAHCLCS